MPSRPIIVPTWSLKISILIYCVIVKIQSKLDWQRPVRLTLRDLKSTETLKRPCDLPLLLLRKSPEEEVGPRKLGDFNLSFYFSQLKETRDLNVFKGAPYFLCNLRCILCLQITSSQSQLSINRFASCAGQFLFISLHRWQNLVASKSSNKPGRVYAS